MTVSFDTLEYDIGGVHTMVKAIGSGQPLLFLHGASTLEGFDFAAGLADRFRVLVPSHPGMGYSGSAPHVSGMADFSGALSESAGCDGARSETALDGVFDGRLDRG